jgi:hypothetical protein
VTRVESILDAARHEAMPTIDAFIETALSQGRKFSELSIYLERDDAGKFRGGIGTRPTALTRLRKHPRIAASQRQQIERTVASRPEDLPVVLVVNVAGEVVIGAFHKSQKRTGGKGFDVDANIELGRFLATRLPPLENEAFEDWTDRVARWVAENGQHPRASGLSEMIGEVGAAIHLRWLVEWARSGFQRVRVDHKLAAVLMTLSAREPEVLTVKPWDAFTIEIPPGLVELKAEGETVTPDTCCVWHTHEGVRVMVMSRSSSFAMGGPMEFPVPELDDEAGIPTTVDEASTQRRALECFQRLVIGAEVEMRDRSHVKAPPAVRAAKDGTPRAAGIHRLLREVKIDCRADIRDWVAGNSSSSPKVLTIVRGHIKQQPHGPRGSLRKWITIDPYPRGLKTAPMAVRSHHLPDG